MKAESSGHKICGDNPALLAYILSQQSVLDTYSVIAINYVQETKRNVLKKPSHLKGRHDGTDGDAVDSHQLRRHCRYLARFLPITRVILLCHSLHTTTNNSKQTSLQPLQKKHHFLVLYTSALHCARRDC